MDPTRTQQLLNLLDQLGLNPAGEPPNRLEPIDEALCHTSAAAQLNHERLEFLGDAVLRLASAEWLGHQHPQLGVGQWSGLRAQLVSDRWLADLGARCSLEAVARIGPMAIGDRAGRATLLAELCEALVGGIYEAWGGGSEGLAAVRRWLEPHWRQGAAELLADPHRYNWKSALQEWSQGLGLGLPRYACQEISRRHGDPRRFHCQVQVGDRQLGEGWGGAIREAEQQAARQALGSDPSAGAEG
ncbi:MAG: putative dsRNA-binding protein [Cyanobacteriota bacterium]|nr:putative dsRNA-binding protein [Cyanobacteriota bacterium]